MWTNYLSKTTVVPKRILGRQLPFLTVDSGNKKNDNALIKLPNKDKVEMLPNLNVHLLERRISCMTVPAIVKAINTACVEGKKITVANYNVHSFNLSMQLPWYYQFLDNAEITHCDSIGILKAIGYMGLNLPISYRSSYSLLMPKLLENCNITGFSVFLLGSKPEILEAAITRLRKQYPNVKFAGHHGYFDKEDILQNEAVLEKINRAKPNILLVGMGMPIQEGWVQKHRNRLDVNAIMLGGAVIDRLAGVVPECPRLLSNVGLEWLYRLYREPKRLAVRYLLGNPAFLLHIALAKFYKFPLQVQSMPPINCFSSVSQSPHSQSQHSQSQHSNLSTATIPNQEQAVSIYTRVKSIAEYFIEANLLTKAQVETALSERKVIEILLGEVSARKEGISEKTIEYIDELLFLRKTQACE
jgi:N-acetylglucosaminyldiphosphoundecaprenol N-acetyl-beta-D-mannosaminyltransferase